MLKIVVYFLINHLFDCSMVNFVRFLVIFGGFIIYFLYLLVYFIILIVFSYGVIINIYLQIILKICKINLVMSKKCCMFA